MLADGGENRGQTPFFPFFLLVAQVQAEGLVIVTADPKIACYGIRTLSAEEKRDTVFATKAPGLFCEWEMGWQGAQETGPP